MANALNISSEEELLQLRNDGKVSEAEYQDLLAAMRKTSQSEDEKLAPGIDKTKSKRKLGKKAFVLMLLGIILPLVLYLIAGLALWPKFFLGLALELAALVMGVIAWSDNFGKGAVAGSLVIMIIALLLFVL